ncbi:MAG: response regulator [Anaerolineae bacterium]
MITILVIEDEDHIREEVMDWLQFEGYQVLGAPNGRLGLELVQRRVPDLILSDIAMPEMNGHEVLLEVRSNPNLSHISFIFLTASAERQSVRKGMELGADDYLTKPFTHAELLRAVHSRLDKEAMRDAKFQTQIENLTSAFSEERERRLLKTRLVAMFSHDFRNPLASILSSSGIIRSYGERLTPERKQQHLDRIDGSVYLLLQMLDDMLMVAEMESGSLDFTPQTLDMGSFVNAIVEEFRLIDQNAHKLLFFNTLHHDVMADAKLLRQIITNLISNALKYSPASSEVNVTLADEGGSLWLAVQDEGMGIPDEALKRLFEPFYRAPNAKHIKGTGLGLSIVKDCVERHNGQVEVTSVMGEGTCFKVLLPHVQVQESAG